MKLTTITARQHSLYALFHRVGALDDPRGRILLFWARPAKIRIITDMAFHDECCGC